MSPAAAGAAIAAPMAVASAAARTVRLDNMVMLLPPVFLVTNRLIG
jgi:hypothetical protein